MLTNRFACLLMGLLGCFSCAGPRGLHYTSPAFSAAARPALSYATPLSAVTFIVGDQIPPRPDWFLSAMVSRSLKTALLQQRPGLPLTTELVIDSLRRPALLREIGRAVQQLGRNTPVDSVRLPLLGQLARQQSQRYTLVLLCRGFTRSFDSYARAAAQGGHSMVLYGVGTMPVKSMTTVCALVYDAESQRLVYARESAEEREPLDQRQAARHLQRLLGADFGFELAH